MLIKNLQQIEKNTFLNTSEDSSISASDVLELEQFCTAQNLDFLRVNLHRTNSSIVQQMILVMKQNYEIKPHYQTFGHVSYNVLGGAASLSLFQKSGVYEEMQLSPDEINFVRLDRKIVRSMVARTRYFSFIETCNGPFRKQNTIWI